jgi:hypothetical protein
LEGKGWITLTIFSKYFSRELQNELKAYCENKTPFKILVVLDSASSHQIFLISVKIQRCCSCPPSPKHHFSPPTDGSRGYSKFQSLIPAMNLLQAFRECEPDDKLSIKEFWQQSNLNMMIVNICNV